MKIIDQLAVPAFVKLSLRFPEVLQKRFMLKVPVAVEVVFVLPTALPCRARIVTKVFPARESKKAKVVELLGEGASTTTKPRCTLPGAKV